MKNESDQALALIKLLFEKVFAFRYIYLGFCFILITSAYFYNKYSTKVYEITTTIGPVKDARSSTLIPNDMFGSGYSGRVIEEAINNLYSFNLISKAVNNLNLEVGYFVDSSRIFKNFTEIDHTPFSVNIDKSHIQTINTKFYITILSDSTFKLEASKKETFLYNYSDNEIVSTNQALNLDTIIRFNTVVSNWNFKFSVSPNEESLHGAIARRKTYGFELYNPEELTKAYMRALRIRPQSYLAAIINVQFNGTNLIKSINFLNNYISIFLEDNLAKKNKIAISTINFIDSQISEMSDSLVTSESQLSNYRANNQVTDISYQGRQLYSQMAVIDADRSELGIQNRYYDYILNYFKVNNDISGITLPSSAKINDPVLSELFSNVLELISERSTISDSSKQNIFLAQIENKIKVQKQVIINHVTNSLNSSHFTLNELNNKAQKLTRDISRLPRQEMNMFNMERKYNMNNEQYSYLLQKRSEASMILASTYPDYEVLEPARAITAKKIRPKIRTNYLLSFFIGILIPSMYLIAKAFFSNKISGIDNLEHLLDHSVFGTIYTNHRKNEAVVKEFPQSAISESFRNLRSSLFVKLNSEQTKVIIVTSSQPQDGKSFIAYNLATSIASVGIKTLLIDCDLRRPNQHIKFAYDNSLGISSFLMTNAIEDKIVKKTFIENLYFIPAGPVLQNPSELISAGNLDDLMNLLKSRFEFIIIDTPPLGIVADTIQLAKYASQILVVTRNNSTKKDSLLNALTILKLNKISNFEIILNDLDLETSPYAGYKNYYNKE